MNALLWLSACTTTVWFPPDLWTWETGFDSGDSSAGTTTTEPPDDLNVVEADASCNGRGNAWTIDAETDGWVSRAAVHVVRSSQDFEAHEMWLVSSDPGGAWDRLRAGPLDAGVPVEEQEPGVETRFDCEQDPQELTWVIRIWAPGDVLSDCVVWGADPNAAIAVVRSEDPAVAALGGCRVIVP